jgi:hypothetical protein
LSVSLAFVINTPGRNLFCANRKFELIIIASRMEIVFGIYDTLYVSDFQYKYYAIKNPHP